MAEAMTLNQVLRTLGDVDPDRVRSLWEEYVGEGPGPEPWEDETEEQAARRWYSRLAPASGG